MPMVDVAHSSGPVPAYLAVPEGPGPWPGVVVIHDAFGFTTDTRQQADWLAGAGFLALAPDLFHWGWNLRCVVSAVRSVAAGKGRAFDEIDTARTWLADRPDCTGRIGVIGFCMGGGFAVVLAAGGSYQAASVNYGSVPKDADDLLAQACPVVGSFGGLDRAMKQTPALLEHALEVNEVPHDVKVYADAGHAFLNDHDPRDVPVWGAIAGRFLPAAYHQPSAVDARGRIESFFHEHLGPQ